MPRTMSLALLIGVLLIADGDLLAKTSDGTVPANEGVCDELLYATPGLYGICVAFCEAQDCEPNFLSADPFSNCKPSAPKLLEVYNRKKGPEDPEMPCIIQTECPCFTGEELWNIGSPYDFCGIESDASGTSQESTCIRNEQMGEVAEVRINLSGRRMCCYLEDSTRRILLISEEEFLACRRMLSLHIDDYQTLCTTIDDDR